jgi:hypothetical protein
LTGWCYVHVHEGFNGLVLWFSQWEEHVTLSLPKLLVSQKRNYILARASIVIAYVT